MSAPTPTITALGAGWYIVRDGARQWRIAVAGPPENRWVFLDGHVTQLQGPREATSRRAAAHSENTVMAPMPATVVSLAVALGQQVKPGDTLLVLEAMKMELPVRASRAGTITALHCAQGDLVQPGVSLIQIE